MPKPRVLLANELCSYREVMAATIGCLRPDVEVFTVEPEDLDGEVVRLAPDLVLCSWLTPMVAGLPNWVVLYPGHESYSSAPADRT